MNNNYNGPQRPQNNYRGDEIKVDTAVNIKKATTKKVIVKSAKVTGFCVKKLFQWILNIFLTLLLMFTICGIIIGSTFAIYVKNYLIDEDFDIEGLERSLDSTTKIYCKNEEGVFVELEEERIYGNENRVWVSYKDIPENLVNAFVSIEDERYWEHNGVDWKRTFGAVLQFASGNDSYGGSTITQQLIKNVTEEDDTTIQRKVTEIFRAITLSEKRSKEEVLEMYLNRIHLSRNNYGVQAAANYYFGCDVSELTLPQCAALAAIPKSPTKYDPVRNPDENRDRRNVVLKKMKELGYITEAEYEEAKNADIGMNITEEDIEEQITKPYSYYKDALIDQIIEDLQTEYKYSRTYASDLLFSGGLEIYTVMDPYVQNIMEEHYENMNSFPVINDGVQPQSAMVIMDPYTGDVLGLVGGRGEKTGRRELNRATHSKRQVGSSIKPLTVYAPAMDKGLISYSTVYDDYPLFSMGRYWPSNSPNGYKGKISINEAVVRSKNTIAVKVMNDMGIDYAYNFAVNSLHFDLVEQDKGTPSLALGGFTYGLSVLDMTAAYCMFPNGGSYMEPRLYSKILNPDGTVLLERKIEPQTVISQSTATVMTKILQNVVSYGTAAGVTLDNQVNCAGKTGTTNDSKDLYFAGFTPYYVGCVWFGYDIPKSLYRFSGASALNAWEGVMRKVHQRHFDEAANGGEPIKKFDFSKLTTASFCLDSGMVPCDRCMNDVRGGRASTGYYYEGLGRPTSTCTAHVTVDWCKDSQSIAGLYCPEESITQVSLFYENDRHLRHGNVAIADAIYTYRNTDMETAPVGVAPFYINSIPEGEHAGYGYAEEGSPANRICPLHTEETAKEEEEKEEEVLLDENGNPIEKPEDGGEGEGAAEGEGTTGGESTTGGEGTSEGEASGGEGTGTSPSTDGGSESGTSTNPDSGSTATGTGTSTGTSAGTGTSTGTSAGTGTSTGEAQEPGSGSGTSESTEPSVTTPETTQQPSDGSADSPSSPASSAEENTVDER